MSVTNNGSKVSAPDEQLPSGYTRPTITTFSDYEYTRRVQLSVAKATVENATKTTTMANIIGNGTIGVTKQVTDLITADVLAANTTLIYADIVKVENNQTVATEQFSSVAAAYLVTVDIYWKSA